MRNSVDHIHQRRIVSEQLLQLYDYQWCPLFQDMFNYILAPSDNPHKIKQQHAVREFVKEYFKEILDGEA